jgi:hypothetical protein
MLDLKLERRDVHQPSTAIRSAIDLVEHPDIAGPPED